MASAVYHLLYTECYKKLAKLKSLSIEYSIDVVSVEDNKKKQV